MRSTSIRDVSIYDAPRGHGLDDGRGRAPPARSASCRNPGASLTQLATSLTVASRAKVPIVVFAGETALSDHDSVQKYNQQKFVDATEAGFFVPIWKASEAEDAVRTAFYRARVESRPIVLNAPMDVQAETYEGDIDEYEPSSTLPRPSADRPRSDRLRGAIKLIAESKHPGDRGRAGRPDGRAGDAIVSLADRSARCWQPPCR